MYLEWRRIVRYNLTDVSEEYTASIFMIETWYCRSFRACFNIRPENEDICFLPKRCRISIELHGVTSVSGEKEKILVYALSEHINIFLKKLRKITRNLSESGRKPSWGWNLVLQNKSLECCCHITKFSPHLVAVIVLETVCTSQHTSRKRISIYVAMLHTLIHILEL
jgi:hypothetical protein